MVGIEATAVFAPVFWGMISLLAVCVAGIALNIMLGMRWRISARGARLHAPASASSHLARHTA